MTTQEFLKIQLDDVGRQVQRVFENLPDDQWDARLTETSMTPRETAEHLTECYQAFLTEAAGEKHQWGSFQAPDKNPQALLALMANLRLQAEQTAIASDDPAHWAHASAFIALHDAYHVGQLVALRLKLGDFHPYSIYK